MEGRGRSKVKGSELIIREKEAGNSKIEIGVEVSPRQGWQERIRTPLPELADAFRKNRDEVVRRMEAIIRSGSKFAVGTDGMHGELARELEYQVGFGASEEPALAVATMHAAAVLGLEESVGTLKAGKFAGRFLSSSTPVSN